MQLPSPFRDAPLEADNAFRDVNAGCQLIRVKRLGHKIIRTGVHRFEVQIQRR